jgi:hypothetical protein
LRERREPEIDLATPRFSIRLGRSQRVGARRPKHKGIGRVAAGFPQIRLRQDAGPSGSTVEGPPLPSQLRFDLDAYDTRPVLTYIHDDQVPGSQFCAVNGSLP